MTKIMNEKAVFVSIIKGQSYGSQSEIRISFHNDSGIALFPKGYSQIHGYYHLDDQDIYDLQENHPDCIPQRGDSYYQGYVTEWGYDVEEGLCLLMLEEKLFLDRHKQGYRVQYKWDTAKPWNAEEHRNKKRRFPKNPNIRHYPPE
jgi:hypothetical protein